MQTTTIFDIRLQAFVFFITAKILVGLPVISPVIIPFEDEWVSDCYLFASTQTPIMIFWPLSFWRASLSVFALTL